MGFLQRLFHSFQNAVSWSRKIYLPSSISSIIDSTMMEFNHMKTETKYNFVNFSANHPGEQGDKSATLRDSLKLLQHFVHAITNRLCP